MDASSENDEISSGGMRSAVSADPSQPGRKEGRQEGKREKSATSD